MKLLVTGGTGFLGVPLVERLLAKGHQVRLIARADPKKPSLAAAELFQGDLKDRDVVRRALAGVDAVYHLAGKVDFDPKDGGRAMYELHVEGTRALLKDATEAKVKRFILASTSGAIAVSKEERIATEADDYPIAVVGRWPYYLSKIYEEKLALEHCRKNALPLVVLNPALLMGPGDDRLSSTWTVSKFLNRDIPSMPKGGLAFVDVRDAADAFVQALEHGEVQGRHLLGTNMSFKEFFGRLERLTGVAGPPLRLSSQGNVWGARLLERVAKARGNTPDLDVASVEIAEHFFYLDASKAERELSFKARDPQETLYDTVQDLLARMPPTAMPGTRGRLAELRGR